MLQVPEEEPQLPEDHQSQSQSQSIYNNDNVYSVPLFQGPVTLASVLRRLSVSWPQTSCPACRL